MELTRMNILEAESAIVAIDKTPLPTKVSYYLGKLLTKIIRELQTISKKREELMNKYGEEEIPTDKDGNVVKGADGNPVPANRTIPVEKTEEVNKEFEAFLAEKVELSIWKLPLSMLEQVKLSPLQMRHLDVFIVNDVPTEDKKK